MCVETVALSQFRRRHSRRNPNPPTTALFFHDPRNSKMGLIPLTGEEKQNQLPPHASHFIRRGEESSDYCHGLLCSEKWHKSDESDGFDLIYSVCNTTTNEYKKLPPLYQPSNTGAIAFNLVLDRSKSHYRIVCVRSTWRIECTADNDPSDDFYIHLAIYKSETNTWSECREPNQMLDRISSEYFNKGVYLNGGIHWVSDIVPFLRFDLDDECFKPMPTTPPTCSKPTCSKHIECFGVAGGHLYVVESCYGQKNVFDVLEMKSDYSEWFLKYRVDLGSVFSGSRCFIISLVRDEKQSNECLAVLTSGCSGSLFTLKEILHDESLELIHWEHVSSYSETLFCVE